MHYCLFNTQTFIFNHSLPLIEEIKLIPAKKVKEKITEGDFNYSAIHLQLKFVNEIPRNKLINNCDIGPVIDRNN